jgi:dTDP-4-amino-4,6-dideoxygalactose transaminase
VLRCLHAMKRLIRTLYTPSGTLFRLLFDIAVANAGMFLGTIGSILLAIGRFPTISQEYFWEMFSHKWLYSIPLLSFSCFLSFPLAGVYGINLRGKNWKMVMPLVRGILGAMAIHIFLVYALSIMIPRSMMVTGWITITILFLSGRLGRSYFVKRYRLVPIDSHRRGLDRLRTSEMVSNQEFGWIPPDSPQAKAPWPFFDRDEILAVASVLRSGKVNQWTGQEVFSFQDEFKAWCGTKHAIALANGTVALELALHGLELQKGDEIIVTPRTFVASAGCAVLAGLRPVFADVDRESQNVTAETIARVITPKTRAIIAVHLAGWPCDMDAIRELATDHGLSIIEDCAQAHGAYYRGRPVGSLGHVAAFSFCQDKIMTTGGEGGLLATEDDCLWKAAWAFKDHGKSFDKVFHKNHPPGFRWLHDSFGTNWRMTEMQAAIGRLQLRKLPHWIEARRKHAAVLQDTFARISALRITQPPADIIHSYYKYYVFVRPEALKTDWTRDRILAALSEKGVACFSGSCSEIYLEQAFSTLGLRPDSRLPVAQELGETSLMFLVHPTLKVEDIQATAETVTHVMAMATR